MYGYAVVVADAIIEGEGRNLKQAKEQYWGFVSVRYKDLIEGRVRPSTMLRQNLQLADRPAEVCEYCEHFGKTQWDHIIPRSRGGPDTIDNHVRACSKCNRSKSALPLADWAKTVAIGLTRMVRAKYLKLLLQAHEQQGTLAQMLVDLPDGQTRRGRIELAAFPFR